MWYARLRIRDDRLAKLWAWKLAEHDVIVWSESDERWKQLLAVPELRAAVRKATTSAFVRKSSPPPALPGAQSYGPESSTRRRHLQTVGEFENDELTTQFSRSSYYPDDMDMEPTAVTFARPDPKPVSSAPPPPPLELLRALTTTIPPAVHSAPAPEFPRAPKVPSISELARSTAIHPSPTNDQGANSPSFLPPPAHSDFREIARPTGTIPQSVYPQTTSSLPVPVSSRPPPPSALRRFQPGQLAARAQYIVAKPVSQLTVKNLSWAMLPIACAGVFAFFLDRYLPSSNRQPAAITYMDADAAEPSHSQLGRWVGQMLGMSLGASQPVPSMPPVQEPPTAPSQTEQTANLTPEQLAPVGAPTKASAVRAPAVHAVASKATASKAAAASRSDDKEKASAQSGNSSASAAQAGFNETFDRDGARTALRFAAARVRNCSNSGVTGSALITFGPSGTVQKVQITQMVGDDVDASCVNRALSNTRVPPFTGAPVTVRKSF
jgi:hypothetical protein